MLTFFAALVLCQTPAPRSERDVVYRTVESMPLHLDVDLPPAGEGSFPALLLVHGGAWMHGDKHDVRELATGFAAKGYACFSIEYRLAPAHRWPAQIDDCVAAVQFVRAEAERFQVDPKRIGALGFSAGGHLVALLGTLDERADPKSAEPLQRQSSRVQCVVDFFGPAILARKPEHDFDTRPPPKLFGDAPDSAYAAASPLTLVSADDAPFLLVHGDADTLVPVQQSILLDEALRKAGVASELIVLEGAGHGDFLAKDPHGEYWKKTEAFLAAKLGTPKH
jgi:acetyl esterase/lipase